MKQLSISVGQATDKGRKAVNQDYHGVYIPDEPLLTTKGISVALADGISSSEVSQIASAAAVKSFLEDYYCTSDSWSVKSSAKKVLLATNSWLHSQTRQSQHRFNMDKGYVCTFSCIVFKATTAHIFHVGDSRVYRLQGQRLEQLTEDHRLWISKDKSHLSRALGIQQQLELDYYAQELETGDVYILATDGIYEFVSEEFVCQTIHSSIDDLQLAAERILKQAYEQGSNDNLTLQIIRIEQLPEADSKSVVQQMANLPFPPKLEARMSFDGYQILREIYISSRSHVYLAVDNDTRQQLVIKTPSVDKHDDPQYLQHFLLEEWIARRIDNAHVLKSYIPSRKRNYLYLITEYIEGQTLKQWMIDNPAPDIETVRQIIEQIAKGLQAFHRQEMLHQDLRPDNVMIDQTGTVKIIDFGATRVAGIVETAVTRQDQEILGTAQYTAPEYFIGEQGTIRSDLYSLAVIMYQMLSGRMPYGAGIAKARSKAALHKVSYQSVLDDKREIPFWLDATLQKALQLDPSKRYQELSEFIYDLRHPNPQYISRQQRPLIERNPVAFWKGLSLFLLVVIIVLLI